MKALKERAMQFKETQERARAQRREDRKSKKAQQARSERDHRPRVLAAGGLSLTAFQDQDLLARNYGIERNFNAPTHSTNTLLRI